MRSWGQLPLNYIDQWKGRKCDLVFTAKRMGERAISFCADAGNGTTVGKDGLVCEFVCSCVEKGLMMQYKTPSFD